jgi:hypothetical protein
MQRKTIALLLALIPSSFSPSWASGSALRPDDVAAMMRAMLSMVSIWNAMNGAANWESPGTWTGAPSPYSPPRPTAPWGWNRFAPQASWPGGGSAFADPRQSLSWRREAARPAATRNQTRLSLSGIWQGNSGDVLVIRGNRFRIHNAEGLHRDGIFQVVGSQFFAVAPQAGVMRRYELAKQGDRLALRDSEGQVLLFERLRQSFPRYKKHIIKKHIMM